ncbi:hypothetical protein BDN70DRAFT_877768 [Pholiota conissans]|uniref:Uncharacterized protein n=1 Tax=Pholiota conissans TaxID=109636 RepID=A0A9P5Z412_9AGAR|nr:hypothetical protein BDN70DRAFT_877768 [Pholiota conissans]
MNRLVASWYTARDETGISDFSWYMRLFDIYDQRGMLYRTLYVHKDIQYFTGRLFVLQWKTGACFSLPHV